MWLLSPASALAPLLSISFFSQMGAATMMAGAVVSLLAHCTPFPRQCFQGGNPPPPPPIEHGAEEDFFPEGQYSPTTDLATSVGAAATRMRLPACGDTILPLSPIVVSITVFKDSLKVVVYWLFIT
jgi:hypothetical protein